MRALIVILCYLLIGQMAEARIFECRDPTGAIIFQDKKCSPHKALQRELVFSDQEFDLKKLRKMQKQLQQYKDDLDKAQMRKLREAKNAEKNREQERKRRMRMRAKCNKIKQKIVMLEQRYKHGYTFKQGLSLDRKLAECIAQRDEYCAEG